jgi:ribose transport system substrate-binding protein
VSGAQGKKVWLINFSEDIAILKQWRETTQKALEEQGVSATVFDGKGQESEWNRGMELAIAADPDAIVLIAVRPELVPARITEAKAAGIPVIATSRGNPGPPEIPGVTAEVSPDFEELGRVQADWFIVDSNGKGDALIFSVSGVPAADWQVKGMKEEIAALCPDCTVRVEDAPFNTWGTQLTNQTASAIQRDPDLGYILPTYDVQTFYVLPGIKQAGANDKIRVGTVNATAGAPMQTLQSGTTPLQLDIGIADDWFNYAIADATFRVLTGNPIVNDYHIGLRAFTPDNTADLDVSKEDSVSWYGVDVASEFSKIWLTS